MSPDSPPTGSPRSQSSTVEGLFRSSISSDRNDISAFLNRSSKALRWTQNVCFVAGKEAGPVEEQMARYRSLLSPIHRLPAGMLANIFNHFCNTAEDPFFAKSAPGGQSLSSVRTLARDHPLDAILVGKHPGEYSVPRDFGFLPLSVYPSTFHQPFQVYVVKHEPNDAPIAIGSPDNRAVKGPLREYRPL
ncbi:hypothetical protein L218DRAFT_1008492 [Marasmius fiardii PR-910]|nr:hypothetical protein L218DRAFT_1008492 [Marasmius fiardii PR-910]